MRIGDELPLSPLDFDFESAAGWMPDAGTSSKGEWVREDPVGTSIGALPVNPEDDTTPDPRIVDFEHRIEPLLHAIVESVYLRHDLLPHVLALRLAHIRECLL